MSLVKQGLVTYEEALKHVSNPDDFALRFRGIASTSDSGWSEFAGEEEGSHSDLSTEGAAGDELASDQFNIDRF